MYDDLLSRYALYVSLLDRRILKPYKQTTGSKNMEKQNIPTLCRMIQHCHNKNNSPAVRQWAAACGKRALLAWATLRTSVV